MTSVNAIYIKVPVLMIWTFYIEACSSQTQNWPGTSTDYGSGSDTVDYSFYEPLCEQHGNRSFRRWFLPTFYSIICFLGLAGNILVILTFFYFKRLKTMTDVYLLNLSFADLLFALSLPLWGANSMAEWLLGLAVCKIMFTVYKISFYSGMFLLTSISMDRYFAIAKAVSAHRHRSHAVFFSKVSSVAIWLLALLCSIPEMKYTNINNNTCNLYTGDSELYGGNSNQLRVGIQASQIVMGFGIPFLIMSFCYCAILQTLYQARSFQKNRAIKVIFAVVAVFLLCQLPYNFVMLLSTLDSAQGGSKDCVHSRRLLYAADITQCLAFLRCCLNPFVYAFIGVKFRHDLLKLMKDLGCMSQERFFRYKCGRRRSSVATDTETTTTFSP